MPDGEILDLTHAPIEEVQAVGFELLCRFADLCEENGWRYWLAYGTLLGAVRHGGFIPWDDDVDVFMPRDDFDAMNKKYSDGGIPGYVLHNSINDERVPIVISRLRKRGTFYPERTAFNCGWREQGAFLDIFPLDGNARAGILESTRFRAFHIFEKLSMHARYRSDAVYGDVSLGGKLAHSMLFRMSRFASPKCWDFLQVAMMRPESRVPVVRYYINFACVYSFSQSAYKSEWFDGDCRLSFCGRDFPVPRRYSEFLSLCYGDYMALPPIEDRRTHRFEPPLDDAHRGCSSERKSFCV